MTARARRASSAAAASLTRTLRRVRGTQPLNAISTSVARAVLRAAGTRSEWLIRHLHRVGDVEVDLPNGRRLRLWSRGDDWISNQVFWRGWAGYEPETAPLFFRLAQDARVTIDVGAFVGYYTLLAAHANPTGRVISLEPFPSVHARLLNHVALNGLKNVVCLRAAAGAREETAEFFHGRQEVPTSSSLSREFMEGVPDLCVTTVPVTTLDRLADDRDLDRVDLVKMDTETTEPDVLAGMRRVLARDRPWIVCEVLRGRGAEERLAPILEPLGYRFFLLTPDGPVRRTRIEGHPDCLNYLFAGRAEDVPRPWSS